LQAGASVQVQTMQQALQAAKDWVQNHEALHRAQAAAVNFANAHQGAAAKTASAVVKLLR